MCFSSSTSAADCDRRDAEAHRQVRVGRSFTQVRVEPERRCRLQPRAYDRRTFRRRSRGAIADQLLRDRDRARLAPPLILFGDGGVNGLLEIRIDRRQRRRIGRAHVDFHPCLERNRVDGRAATDASDVERRLRMRRHLHLLDLRDGAPHRAHRVREAEGAEAVTAGSLERDPVAVAADGDVGHVNAGAVDRHERIDLSLHRVVEQRLDAAQIAEPLLADVRHEGNRSRRRHAGVFQRLDDPDEHGQTAAIVADSRSSQDVAVAAHFHVGAFGKHGVEMRRDYDVRMRRGAWPIAEHVAGFVDPHALQAELVERALQLGAASLLFERRRSDLTESNLILNRLRLGRLRRRERKLDGRLLQEIRDGALLRCRGRRSRRQHQNKNALSQSFTSRHVAALRRCAGQAR